MKGETDTEVSSGVKARRPSDGGRTAAQAKEKAGGGGLGLIIDALTANFELDKGVTEVLFERRSDLVHGKVKDALLVLLLQIGLVVKVA